MLASGTVAVAPRLALAQAVSATVDVLISGGTVYDGSGLRGRVADVGLRGDRIVFVGKAPAGTVAATRIDATWADRLAGLHRPAHACL